MGADTKGKQDADIDFVLTEIGNFGRYQIMNYALISIPVGLMACYVVGFVFTAAPLDYRCKITECDSLADLRYDQPWLRNAIPFRNDHPRKCLRYSSAEEVSRTNLITRDLDQCPVERFNRNKTEKCSEFVFKTDEVNILNEFGIFCEENEYKLALVGMLGNIGRLISLPTIGLLADRYGRLAVLINGAIVTAILGIIKAFSVSYTMFLIFEVLDACASPCIFGSAFILGVEWVSSRRRVASATIIAIFFPLGEVLLGFIAMYVHNFRYLILAIYVPCLVTISYHWIVPESVRWQLATKRYERAEKSLLRAAKFNNVKLSQLSLEIIREKCHPVESDTPAEVEVKDKTSSIPLTSIFTTGRLCLRLLNLCICWMVCAFVYYGLSLSAATIKGDDNKYISFILVVASEIPGLFASLFIDKIGRKCTLILCFILAGISVTGSALISSSSTFVIMLFFIGGKCTVTCAFTSLYVFTAELWPTSLRSTVSNLCSSIGRIGAILVPLTPLLGQISPRLPFFLFGGTAIGAAFLIVLLPETSDGKLPETLEEAVNLGKNINMDSRPSFIRRFSCT